MWAAHARARAASSACTRTPPSRSRDRVAADRLSLQLEVVTDELRKRVGQTFTLEDLAAKYAAADEWVRDTVSERAPTPGWPRTLAIVQDAAFHLYQRGAVDYSP